MTGTAAHTSRGLVPRAAALDAVAEPVRTAPAERPRAGWGWRSGPGGGRSYAGARWLGAGVFGVVVVGLVVSIATGSAEAFARYGIGFVWSGTYSPPTGQYGAGILLAGTVLTTALAIALAAPVGLGAALAISEVVPKKVAAVASALVELLAAVPSIVVGLWALLVLSPVFAAHVEPFLRSLPLAGRLFAGPAYGPGILLASVVLAIMVLPTLVSLTRTALNSVPVADREAALALGATPWQVARKVVWPAARPGMAAAVTLAVGRALGEAIAVAMVVGNQTVWPGSLSSPGATLGSAIVNQFAEAQPGLGASSVIALAGVLLVLTVVVNAGGQLLRRVGERSGSRKPGQHPVPAAGAPGVGQGPWPVLRAQEPGRQRSEVPASPAPGYATLTPRRGAGLRRRLLWGRGAQCATVLMLATACAPLAALLAYTAGRSLPKLSWGLLVNPVAPAFVPGGGIATAIAGSAKDVGLALLIAAPLSLLVALFLYERAGRLAAAVRFSADVMSGVPSIVIGIFVYEVIVRTMHHPSTFAAGVALAVLMLPIMVRADEEAVRAVPVELVEGGSALGATRWRVVRSVVLRSSLPGLVSGNLLALARAVGETAPLMFTVAAPSLAMTLLVYSDGTQPYPEQQQLAWAAALVLVACVLVLSALARFAAWYLTRRAR